MKKRNRKGRSEGSGGGMMMGMRRGFKNAARSVTGQKQSKSKNKAMDWLLTAVFPSVIRCDFSSPPF
jgi:hypothetical protein